MEASADPCRGRNRHRRTRHVEADTNLHYPTNGNPVLLADAAAKTAFDAYFGR